MNPFLAKIRMVILMLLQNAHYKGSLEWGPHNDLLRIIILVVIS